MAVYESSYTYLSAAQLYLVLKIVAIDMYTIHKLTQKNN